MKQKNIFNLFLFLILVTIYSCKSSFPPSGTQINCNGQMLVPILNPTQRPEFIGGSPALFAYMKENLRSSIKRASKKSKGKIRAAFVVTKQGEICDVRIASKPTELIDDEAIRVIQAMPKWRPGINQGTIVDAYVLIDFEL